MSDVIYQNTTCGQCRHWIRFAGENIGVCYRFPPVPTVSGAMLRPRTKEREQGCGEFAPGFGGAKSKLQPETFGAALKARRI